MRYEAPIYEKEYVETDDVILASSGIRDEGEGTLGNISGEKGSHESSFWDIF